MAGPLTPFIPLLAPAAKGLFWTGTAAGAAGGAAASYDWFSGIGKKARKDIIREGPDSFGDYDVPFYLRPFIDVDSLEDSRNKYVMDLAKKEVADLQALDPSWQLTNGMTGADFKKKYATQIRAAKLNNQLAERDAIANSVFKSPQQVEERRVSKEQRTDLLNQQRLSRQDANNRFLYSERMADKRRAHEAQEGKLIRRHESELAENSNNLTMQMSLMQNDLSEKRMDYDRETRRLDKRSEAIAQLMSGLGALGGAFAV